MYMLPKKYVHRAWSKARGAMRQTRLTGRSWAWTSNGFIFINNLAMLHVKHAHF